MPLVRGERVVECDVFPVVVNVLIDAKVVPAVVEYAQVAFSLVVTEIVVLVVPVGSVPVGAVTVITGGVVSMGAETVTVALTTGEEPPVPVQVIEYVVLVVGETDCVPLTAFVPDHPPEAVQVVALVLVHESVEEEPEVIEVGAAERETVGMGLTFTRKSCALQPSTPVS